jgi:hypothetical protein
MAKRRKRRPEVHRSPHAEATYILDSCGEEIMVPVDITAGSHQDYVEDCPVCCHPLTLHVEVRDDGEAHIQG